MIPQIVKDYFDPDRKLTFSAWVFFFLSSIVSRLLTTIRYIEDPDSLRFALATINYDVAALQPHFPAYPVFCFFVKVFYFLTGNFSIAFSLVGGLATFAIIYFTVRSAVLLWKETPQLLLALLLFFNPLIWLMGNRFMPDLCGLAVSIAGIYFFIRWFNARSEESWKQSLTFLILFGLAIGLLGGVRVSYLPLLAIPFLFMELCEGHINRMILSGAIVVVGLAWLGPLVIDTGWPQLMDTAQTQTSGHFEDFGGTISTESDFGARTLVFFKHGWADGLGGFWLGRHWITLIFSVCLIPFLIMSIFRIKSQSDRRLYWLLLFSFIAYAAWILFFQNIIFKSRHHLPLIPFFLVLIGLGFNIAHKKKSKFAITIVVVLLAANAWITLKLVIQHKNPTAIAQLKNHLEGNNFEDQILVTSDLVKYYLEKQKIKANFVDINNENPEIQSWLDEGKKIYIVANLDVYHNYPLKRSKIFYHNPFVNRMWPIVILSEVQLKPE